MEKKVKVLMDERHAKVVIRRTELEEGNITISGVTGFKKKID